MAPPVSVPPSSSRQAPENQAPESQGLLKKPWQPSYRFGCDVLTQLQKRLEDPLVSLHLDDGYLADLGVSCRHMDFDPDARHGDALLQLMSAKEMQTLAEEYRFSSISGHSHGDPDNLSLSGEIIDLLEAYLLSVPQPDDDVEEMLEIKKTEWSSRCLDVGEYKRPHMAGCYYTDQHWGGDFVLENPTYPHVKTFLAAAHPLCEDGLMFSELWTIVQLGTYRFARRESAKFRHIAVTLISGSGRNFRVIQGWIDGENKVVNIRKTGIIHLGEGEAPYKDPVQRPKILTLMRWLIAEPISGSPPQE
ncbi:hypothetical protein GGR57DRAFT_502051 [Xylariaceae sp. FL1272]|nr:hypothetical protein GGR57DRAFT_502051 [Xylariaceae sp. FL1272]